MAKMAVEIARGGWRRGVALGLGAITADVCMLSLVLAGVRNVSIDPRLMGILAFCGLLVMNAFAVGAWRGARRPPTAPTTRLTGWAAGVLMSSTNPFVLGWWATTGVAFFAQYGPDAGVGFLLAVFAILPMTLALFGWAATTVARFEMYVSYVAACFLWAFSVLLGVRGFELLTR